ncbi:MAG: hypothetical protein Q7T74_05845 [Candidatus Saccharibacteria bacterium]|nr:hypothetical protein [Candidatus Saccharibacteria bacterium]
MSELISEKKFVIVPDIHGRSDLFGMVADEYTDAQIVAIGDTIGRGPDSAGVLDIAQKTGTILTWGNWELYMMAGLVLHDLDTRRDIQHVVKPFEYDELQKFAVSYDIDTSLPRQKMIESLTAAMQERGHLNMLARAAMYFETDDFIAIHAGLTDEPLVKQKEQLAKVKGTFDEPAQIVDDGQFSLATRAEAFTATDKIVITGHAHSILGNRVTAGGKRVRLASKVNDGQPLYVWQSWQDDNGSHIAKFTQS